MPDPIHISTTPASAPPPTAEELMAKFRADAEAAERRARRHVMLNTPVTPVRFSREAPVDGSNELSKALSQHFSGGDGQAPLPFEVEREKLMGALEQHALDVGLDEPARAALRQSQDWKKTQGMVDKVAATLTFLDSNPQFTLDPDRHARLSETVRTLVQLGTPPARMALNQLTGGGLLPYITKGGRRPELDPKRVQQIEQDLERFEALAANVNAQESMATLEKRRQGVVDAARDFTRGALITITGNMGKLKFGRQPDEHGVFFRNAFSVAQDENELRDFVAADLNRLGQMAAKGVGVKDLDLDIRFSRTLQEQANLTPDKFLVSLHNNRLPPPEMLNGEARAAVSTGLELVKKSTPVIAQALAKRTGSPAEQWEPVVDSLLRQQLSLPTREMIATDLKTHAAIRDDDKRQSFLRKLESGRTLPLVDRFGAGFIQSMASLPEAILRLTGAEETADSLVDLVDTSGVIPRNESLMEDIASVGGQATGEAIQFLAAGGAIRRGVAGISSLAKQATGGRKQVLTKIAQEAAQSPLNRFLRDGLLAGGTAGSLSLLKATNQIDALVGQGVDLDTATGIALRDVALETIFTAAAGGAGFNRLLSGSKGTAISDAIAGRMTQAAKQVGFDATIEASSELATEVAQRANEYLSRNESASVGDFFVDLVSDRRAMRELASVGLVSGALGGAASLGQVDTAQDIGQQASGPTVDTPTVDVPAVGQAPAIDPVATEQKAIKDVLGIVDQRIETLRNMDVTERQQQAQRATLPQLRRFQKELSAAAAEGASAKDRRRGRRIVEAFGYEPAVMLVESAQSARRQVEQRLAQTLEADDSLRSGTPDITIPPDLDQAAGIVQDATGPEVTPTPAVTERVRPETVTAPEEVFDDGYNKAYGGIPLSGSEVLKFARNLGGPGTLPYELVAGPIRLSANSLTQQVRRRGGEELATKSEAAINRSKELLGRVSGLRMNALRAVGGVQGEGVVGTVRNAVLGRQSGTPAARALNELQAEDFETLNVEGATLRVSSAPFQRAIEMQDTAGLSERAREVVDRYIELQRAVGKEIANLEVPNQPEGVLLLAPPDGKSLEVGPDGERLPLESRPFPEEGDPRFLRALTPEAVEFMTRAPEDFAAAMVAFNASRGVTLHKKATAEHIRGMSRLKLTRQAPAELLRLVPHMPTSIEWNGQFIPVLETDPATAIETMVNTFADRMGFISQFGQGIELVRDETGQIKSTKVLRPEEHPDVEKFLDASARQGFSQQMSEAAVTQLWRALNGMAVFTHEYGLFDKTKRVGRHLRHLETMIGVLKATRLSAAALTQVAEPISTLPAMAGVGVHAKVLAQQFARIWSPMARQHHTEMVEVANLEGYILADTANYLSQRPNDSFKNLERRFKGVLGDATLLRSMNEGLERLAAVAGLSFVQAMKAGSGKLGDGTVNQSMLVRVETTRPPGGVSESVRLVRGEGTDAEYARFVRSFVALTAGGAGRRKGETSFLGNSRLHRSLRPFQSFAQTKVRAFLELNDALHRLREAGRSGEAGVELRKLLMTSAKLNIEMFAGTLASGMGQLLVKGMVLYGPQAAIVGFGAAAVDDWYEFVLDNFISGMGGGQLEMAYHATDKVKGGRFFDLLMPISVGREFHDALENLVVGGGDEVIDNETSRYFGMTRNEAWVKFFSAQVPASRYVKSVVALNVAGGENPVLDEALRSMGQWKRENLPGPRQFTSPEDLTPEQEVAIWVRAHMRQALRAFQRKDYAKTVRAMLAAADIKGLDPRAPLARDRMNTVLRSMRTWRPFNGVGPSETLMEQYQRRDRMTPANRVKVEASMKQALERMRKLESALGPVRMGELRVFDGAVRALIKNVEAQRDALPK